jgi:phosphatidate cytidylyltransferase
VLDADHASHDAGPAASGHNLALRIVSALVLAPLALGAAYVGGWPFLCFWTVASIAVLWEWTALVAGPDSRLAFSVGAVALAVVAALFALDRPGAGILVVLLGALATTILAPAERRIWVAGGVVYAGIMLWATVLLRADPVFGFIALIFLFAVVWATDILGYFVGRAIGGPKLAPSISPKKTWSGGIAGALGAMVIALLLARYVAGTNWIVIVFIALMLSMVAQAGDLLESALKRRFGAKDAGNLIPGHGGVMDRLDGFWAAALIGVLIGMARGGFDASARGLLIW